MQAGKFEAALAGAEKHFDFIDFVKMSKIFSSLFLPSSTQMLGKMLILIKNNDAQRLPKTNKNDKKTKRIMPPYCR